ncbi:hypothetical protein PP175_13885 [Aneurinibacillus sp. Ricciae_BoGa-3]|uniref:hypothetical protein n=1 Tax=Aneurinibacillus sp. Ricciae_BoGa-3 TaxID=3022697 RepID=UPI00234217FF|nr:hypothetical protein [Aneurinibacillus sp. Ricciae_BoGa-3]WCK52531.1 hypothetical protein PP175_13885 [Aneurinibacillus sp. Ricciae_BoGa-3]
MATNKEIITEKTVMQTENQNAGNIVDFMWDSWLNGIKTVYACQREVENVAMSIAERQKELWNVAIEKSIKFQQEVRRFLEDARCEYQNNLKSVGGEQFSKVFEEWNNRLNEISDGIKKITETPEKAGFSAINNSHEQMEASFKSLIEHQQKTRDEIKSLVSNFVNEVKTTQKGMLRLLEENKDEIMSIAKQ